MWHTFRHSRYIEQKCVYAHVGNLKVLNCLTALASAPSPLSNAAQPLYWKTLSSSRLRREEGHLSAFLFKPGETRSTLGKSGCRDDIVSEVKCVPIQRSGQFVLLSPATESLAGIKGLCPRLKTGGHVSLTAHNSDQPQLVLISHSWGFFFEKGLGMSKPRTMGGPASIQLKIIPAVWGWEPKKAKLASHSQWSSRHLDVNSLV